MADLREVPSSLLEAHEVLWQQRPSRDAAPAVWVAFHRRSADIYAQTAKVDVRHQHEATQYAAVEIRRAREIEHRLDPSLDDES